MDTEIKELILQEHRRTELERLRAGYDGCGCADCQPFYKTIDLLVYGERVKSYGGLVIISAGKDGADLWKTYHQREMAETEEQDTTAKLSRTFSNRKNDSAKVLKGITLPTDTPKSTFAPQEKPIGRPRKTGEVSRWALLRRRQRDKKLQRVMAI